MRCVVAAAISGPHYFRADSFPADMDGEIDVEPALCAVENRDDDSDDLWEIRSVRFDAVDSLGREDRRLGRTGTPFVPTLAYKRRSSAASVAARHISIDLASVVGV